MVTIFFRDIVELVCMLHVNNKKIVSTVRICDTFFSHWRGLQFRKEIVDEAYVFVQDKELPSSRMAIHMVWVFFPIDVIWLDKNKKIVHIARCVKPFTLYCAPKVKSQYFVELPCDTVKRHAIALGQLCEW